MSISKNFEDRVGSLAIEYSLSGHCLDGYHFDINLGFGGLQVTDYQLLSIIRERVVRI